MIEINGFEYETNTHLKIKYKGDIFIYRLVGVMEYPGGSQDRKILFFDGRILHCLKEKEIVVLETVARNTDLGSFSEKKNLCKCPMNIVLHQGCQCGGE